MLKVRVRAIAEGGEANRAVMELMAKALGVPKARVRILSGATSRLKQIADRRRSGKAWRCLAKLWRTGWLLEQWPSANKAH